MDHALRRGGKRRRFGSQGVGRLRCRTRYACPAEQVQCGQPTKTRPAALKKVPSCFVSPHKPTRFTKAGTHDQRLGGKPPPHLSGYVCAPRVTTQACFSSLWPSPNPNLVPHPACGASTLQSSGALNEIRSRTANSLLRLTRLSWRTEILFMPFTFVPPHSGRRQPLVSAGGCRHPGAMCIQNSIFMPSCTTRGHAHSVVIRPNEVLVTLVFGLLNWAWLSALIASARICS